MNDLRNLKKQHMEANSQLTKTLVSKTAKMQAAWDELDREFKKGDFSIDSESNIVKNSVQKEMELIQTLLPSFDAVIEALNKAAKATIESRTQRQQQQQQQHQSSSSTTTTTTTTTTMTNPSITIPVSNSPSPSPNSSPDSSPRHKTPSLPSHTPQSRTPIHPRLSGSTPIRSTNSPSDLAQPRGSRPTLTNTTTPRNSVPNPNIPPPTTTTPSINKGSVIPPVTRTGVPPPLLSTRQPHPVTDIPALFPTSTD